MKFLKIMFNGDLIIVENTVFNKKLNLTLK